MEIPIATFAHKMQKEYAFNDIAYTLCDGKQAFSTFCFYLKQKQVQQLENIDFGAIVATCETSASTEARMSLVGTTAISRQNRGSLTVSGSIAVIERLMRALLRDKPNADN